MGLSAYNFLLQLDLSILKLLNATLENSKLDGFWLFVTQMHKSPAIWVMAPLIVGWSIYMYRWNAVKVLIAAGVAVLIADSVAYRGIKHIYERPRPFQNPEISSWLRKIGHAHGPSFPSNHAANCFAAAFVLSWYFRRGRYVFYILAATVALSRIMLGLHYPSDVLAGALIGISAGWLVTTQLARRAIVSKKRREDWNWRSRSRRLTRD